CGSGGSRRRVLSLVRTRPRRRQLARRQLPETALDPRRLPDGAGLGGAVDRYEPGAGHLAQPLRRGDVTEARPGTLAVRLKPDATTTGRNRTWSWRTQHSCVASDFSRTSGDVNE